MKLFLYNKHVVYKTGRKAVKRDGQNNIVITLFEIESCECIPSWTTWASDGELLEVVS